MRKKRRKGGRCELLCTPAPRQVGGAGHGSDEDPGEVGQQPQVPSQTTFKAGSALAGCCNGYWWT